MSDRFPYSTTLYGIKRKHDESFLLTLLESPKDIDITCLQQNLGLCHLTFLLCDAVIYKSVWYKCLSFINSKYSHSCHYYDVTLFFKEFLVDTSLFSNSNDIFPVSEIFDILKSYNKTMMGKWSSIFTTTMQIWLELGLKKKELRYVKRSDRDAVCLQKFSVCM